MIFFFPVFLLSYITPPDIAEQEIQIKTVAYSADSMVFYPETRDIILIGSTSVDYQDMSLEADTVRFFSSDNIVWASGDPVLFEGNESVHGEEMVYNLRSRQGRVFSAASRYEFGYYGGEEITRISPTEYNLVNATFTTSEADPPHYYFFCPKMKVFPENKAIARPVYMYVYDTRILYIPFWVFPIRRGRNSGFTIPKFGQTSRDGRFLRDIGYYWGFSDYIDLLLSMDIMEKTRFVLEFRERHRLRYVHDGNVRGEWRREFQTQRDRWLLFGQHVHQFPDDLTARFQGEFISDNSYLSETQQSPEDRMTRELRSWFSMTKNWERASLQTVLDRTSYLDTDPDTIPDEILSIQNLPDIRFTKPSSPIFSTPSDPTLRRIWHSLYWNLSAHYTATDTEREDSRSTYAGLKTTSDITASHRVGGWLAFSPRMSGISMIYDRNQAGEKFPYIFYGGASLSLGTDIYGVFPANLFDIIAVRHTISPSVTLNLSPGTYIEGAGSSLCLVPTDSASNRLYSFSDFSLPSSKRMLSFNLYNNLEIKRNQGDRIIRRQVAELALTTSLNLESEEKPWSPVSAGLTISPFDAFQTRLNGSYDIYSGTLDNLTLLTSLRLAGGDPTLIPDSLSISSTQLSPWRITLSHNYRFGTDGVRDLSKMRITTSMNITPRWSIDYNAYYDLLDRNFINQSYTLRRDLDSWEAVFVRHVSDIDSGFYFRIYIKDLPDIKIEQHVSNF